MGRKVAYLAMGVGGVSSILQVVALLTPLHSTAFFSFGVRLAQLSMYAGWATWEKHGSDFCIFFPDAAPGGEQAEYQREKNLLCTGQSKTYDMEDFNQRWCAYTLKKFWPQFCRGTELAFLFGVTLMIVVGINAVLLQSICFVMLYDYTARKPTVKKRKMARNMTGGGALLTAVCILAYLLSVTVHMDSLHGARALLGFKHGLAASDATGVGIGIFLLCTALCLQVLQVVLFSCIPSHEEALFAEFKENKEFIHSYGAVLDPRASDLHDDLAAAKAVFAVPAPLAGALAPIGVPVPFSGPLPSGAGGAFGLGAGAAGQALVAGGAGGQLGAGAWGGGQLGTASYDNPGGPAMGGFLGGDPSPNASITFGVAAPSLPGGFHGGSPSPSGTPSLGFAALPPPGGVPSGGPSPSVSRGVVAPPPPAAAW